MKKTTKKMYEEFLLSLNESQTIHLREIVEKLEAFEDGQATQWFSKLD